MQVIAKLNNLRMSSRKVRLIANLVKGMDARQAKAQLQYLSKKTSAIVLKLLNSGLSNAKNNFNLNENNLYLAKLIVEAGPSLKRWMPRAMGRATPILKRTSSIVLVLDEKVPSKEIVKAKGKKAMVKSEPEPAEIQPVVKEETISAFTQEPMEKRQQAVPTKPYGASSESKKKFFSRQTFGNIKKTFRRKSI